MKSWRSFPRLAPWEWVVFSFAMANFVAFLIISLWLGGTAANGMIEGSRYYLGEHGHYTEVSREVFTYSQNHQRSLFVTHILGMGVVLLAKAREMAEGAKE